jgi:O-succinylbenzoic acid--CoA ligase
MNTKLPDILRLTGMVYRKSEMEAVIRLSAESDDPLIREVMHFLKIWFDDNHLIELKTSGSTGAPKTIMAEKQKLVNSARMTIDYFNITQNDQLLLCMSPAFIAGKMMIVRAMLSGANLITTTVEANPLLFLNKQIDFAAMVPLQVSTILKESPDKLKLLKKLIIGGSSLPGQIETELQYLTTACWHTYGMTETFSHIALRPLNGLSKSELFSPLKGVSLTSDQRGCLVIKAPLLSDTPVVTNDLVDIYDGRFKVLGRHDEVVVSAGNKIHPALVERKLNSLINQRFFIGSAPHADAGEEVVLCLEEALSLSALYKLWNDISQVLEPHEIPRRILQCKEFKMLPSGKIDKSSTLKACIGLKP